MQRPDNIPLLISLALAGAIVMAIIGIICHIWVRRIIISGRHLAIRICVPLLLLFLVLILYLAVPVALDTFYQISYGYQLQPGEAPGPLGDSGLSDFVFGPLILFGLVLLFGYAIFLPFLALRQPANRRREQF
jgi:hypothetical protein